MDRHSSLDIFLRLIHGNHNCCLTCRLYYTKGCRAAERGDVDMLIDEVRREGRHPITFVGSGCPIWNNKNWKPPK